MESQNSSQTNLGIVGLDETSGNQPPLTAKDRVYSASPPIRVLLAVILTTYWLSMYAGTHLPRIPVSLAHHSDKLLHCCAYFGLSVLLLAWRQTRGMSTWRTILRILALIAIYGAFDELTQPIVGRDAEIMDWVADVVGASLGLGLTWPIVSRLLHRNESSLRLVTFETSNAEGIRSRLEQSH